MNASSGFLEGCAVEGSLREGQHSLRVLAESRRRQSRARHALVHRRPLGFHNNPRRRACRGGSFDIISKMKLRNYETYPRTQLLTAGVELEPSLRHKATFSLER